MTSHEMRNPLSAILQSADWIVSSLHSEPGKLSPGAAEEIIDAAETIILCAQHQKRIVDDILTISKLDASLLMISPDKIQPPLLVSKALKMYEAEIVRGRITATLCIEPTYTELAVDYVLLDSSRLLQVRSYLNDRLFVCLRNLLTFVCPCDKGYHQSTDERHQVHPICTYTSDEVLLKNTTNSAQGRQARNYHLHWGQF